MGIVDWVTANWNDVAAIFGSLVAAATVIVKLTPSKADDLLLSKLVRVFSLIGRSRKLVD